MEAVRGTPADRMQQFYDTVIAAYAKASGGSSKGKKWTERLAEYRKPAG